MAFDMPLEADQPGETRFFLSFVTSPVVGTLMWILGGDSESKDNNAKSGSSEDEHDRANNENDDDENINSNSKIDAHLSPSSKLLSRPIPDLVESDNSCADDDGDCSSFAENWGHSSQIYQISTQSRIKKRTSWSDQSGQSLTEYFDERSHHEPVSDAQPVRSAMKRSGTSRFNSNSGSCNDLKDSTRSRPVNPLQHQFIPSGITSSSGGLIMPSGGGIKPSSAVSGGHISPQWGWYISTTPPPLEKYSDPKHAKNILKQKGTNVDLKISEVPTTVTRFSSNPPMPVFKKTFNGKGRTHMEWSSIPL